ncbi:MAG: SAP domain-containing protein [Ignavibacteria bacterium]
MDKSRLSDIAKQYLVFDDGQGEVQLVRRIQQARGEHACFATAEVRNCNQLECLWREDCLSAMADAGPDH